MPARQPYTTLCQAASRVHPLTRVDLHVHSTYSDGLYTPGEIVGLARRSGLAALAITDHDTLEAIVAARAAAAPRSGRRLCVIFMTADVSRSQRFACRWKKRSP